jgi:hypothetical protein
MISEEHFRKTVENGKTRFGEMQENSCCCSLSEYFPMNISRRSKIIGTYLMGHQMMVNILVCVSSSWHSGLHT